MRWIQTLSLLIGALVALIIFQISQIITGQNWIILIVELSLMLMCSICIICLGTKAQISSKLIQSGDLHSLSQSDLIALLHQRARQDAADATVKALTGGQS